MFELEEVEDVRIAELCTKIESPRVLRLIAGVVETVLLFLPESIRLPLLARLVRVLGLSDALAGCLRAMKNVEYQFIITQCSATYTYCSFGQVPTLFRWFRRIDLRPLVSYERQSFRERET